MSAFRSLTPDERQLLETFGTALEVRLSQTANTDEETLRALRALGIAAEESRAVATAAALHDLLWGGRFDLAELIARAALLVAGSGIVTATRAEDERSIGACAGALVARELAAKTGYRLPITPELNSLLAQHGRALASTLSYVRLNLIPDDTPRPRILFLTPLTTVPRVERDRLLEVVQIVAAPLKRMGLRVNVPGDRLSPDTTPEWTTETMFATEREHILSADMTVTIADKHESYGAGQSQSWCETNQAAVHVYSEFTSRVLGCGYWGTSAEPFTTAHQAATKIVQLVRDHRVALLAHAAQSAEIRREWTENVLLKSPSVLAEGAQHPTLSQRRRSSLASDGLEVTSMTLRELIDLRRANPEEVDATIMAMVEKLSAPAPAPIIPSTVKASIGRLIGGRAMPRADASALALFCRALGVEPEELRILFAFQDSLASSDTEQLVGARTHPGFDVDWWNRTLTGIRTTRGHAQ